MKIAPTLALVSCFVATGHAAAWTSGTSTSSSSRINSSTSTTTSSSSTSGGSDVSVTTTTSTSSSRDGVGRASGTTSCSIDSHGRRCEITCSAPKVARCAKAAAERMPLCSCR